MTWKPIKSVDYLVIHCAATKASMDIGAEEIRKWHRERGWFDIGYHYVIRRDGTIEKGRPDDRPGAHARGYNHISLGICLVGGVADDGRTPENNFTDEQWTALEELIAELHEKFPTAMILGHRDLPNVNKGCPSFDVAEWIASLEEKRNVTEAEDSELPEEARPPDTPTGIRPLRGVPPRCKDL